MSISMLATIIGIVGGGGFIGIVGKLIKVGMQYQDLLNRVAQNEKRDEEERQSNALKFNELYNSRNKTNEALVELTTTVKMMVSNIDQQFSSLNKKIDELNKTKKRGSNDS